MNRSERTLLLVWFVLVVVVLVTQVALVSGILGAVAGVALGLPLGRTALLRGRRSTALARRGVDLRRGGRTVAGHVGVLVVLVVVAALVPGLRDRFVALVGALVTAVAATVTAERVRGV